MSYPSFTISFSFSLFLVLVLVAFYLPLGVRSESDHLLSVITEVCAGVGTPGSCPVKCFRADPVCGVDGATYWCGCPDAACHGAEVVKLGPCEVGNGGPAQALLLVHIIWLFFLAFAVLFGLF